MRFLVSAMLLVVAGIHLLPLSGVLGGARLTALYGIPIDEPSLAILMRHRAVLFGMLGSFLVYAAFAPRLQIAAVGAGFVSVASFLWLAWSAGGYNAQLSRVVVADVVALVCLLVAAVGLTVTTD
jgi:hypothetical protein